jgi:hypothetical protein
MPIASIVLIANAMVANWEISARNSLIRAAFLHRIA